MTPTEQVDAISEALRTVIVETSESYLKEDPKDAYADMACRLVLELASKGITIAPTIQATEERARRIAAESALRIFESVGRWIAKKGDRSYMLLAGGRAPVELYVHVGDDLRAFFTGETVQDAHAQFAQTLNFNNGDLDVDLDELSESEKDLVIR